MNSARSRACSVCYATLLLLVVFYPRGLCGQTAREGISVPVILDVTNYHVTMGQKIPSVYVRVFSDRTVECHALQPSGKETDEVRKTVLTEEEYKDVLATVEQPKRLSANLTYGLKHMVFDSWMEWDIKIPRKTGEQEISIADFGSTSLGAGTYPTEIEKLGCSIARLRDWVYGDEREYRRANCLDLSRLK